MASHRSAAHLWGVERPETDPIDVTLPGRSRRARLEGVTIHRPRDLEDLRPVVRHGIPATNPLRVLVDLGAVDAAGVTPALRHLVLAGFVTPLAVSAALDRHARQGRSGVRPLRAALEAWMIDGRPSDSELEQRMAAVAAQFHLPPMRFHPVVEGHEVDFVVAGTCLVVECDGWSTHGAERAQFERDRERDADLTAAGWVVLRVTWRHLFSRPHAAATRIARNVWRWAPDVAAAHLVAHPTSILGATRPS
jgi:very-short-patch-repair endonuclease